MFIVMRFLRIWKIHANFLICNPPISLPYVMYIKGKKCFLSLATHSYEMMWKEIKFAFFALSLTQYSLNSIVLIQKVSFRLQRKGEFFFTFSSREHTQSGNMPSSNISEAESYSRKYTIASTGVESKKKKVWNAVERSTVNFPWVDVTFFSARPQSDGFW